ncbi:hypothetical protein HNR00_004020 [Methylorubrum rhodinum]|uniref:Uncharacterized protein n=1 Tax=Methylorubrum rhodinum TaxID=29428 RepID=A0A840ZQF3_9HYPH|nr:hypothetical protein [Methylorubrum rhodinum]MBB5759288.1 hypothetical protein [Methylorubrum rhodinum]
MSELSGSTTRAAPRRTLDIEVALQWAYRDELPKRRDDHPLRGIGYPSTHPMWRAGAFGGRIDCWNRDPGFPLAMGDPSPDALRIEAAVEALDDATLDILPYDVGKGLGEHVDLRHVISITRRDVRSWIVTYARNGKRPDLGGPAEFEPVRGANGKAEIWETVSIPAGEGPDGTPWFTTFDRRTTSVRAGTYPDGAFCKLQWVRTADDIAEDRARYALWHAGLTLLAEILTPVLQTVAVAPPAAVTRPWIEAEPAPPTIRPNLARRTVALDRRRPVARRAPGRRPEPVRMSPPSEWKPAGAA